MSTNFSAEVEMAHDEYRLWLEEFLEKHGKAGYAALIEEIPGIASLGILLADPDNMTEDQLNKIRDAVTESLTRAMISVEQAKPLGLEKIKAIADAYRESKASVN